MFGISKPFLLLVGGMNPRKNWRLAIESVLHARSVVPVPIDLVITGPMQGDLAEFRRVLSTASADSWVHYLGPVDSEVLSQLYRTAFALIHPSLHEGFGLTILEAFSYGLPVVASCAGSIPEVAGDAAILVEDWLPASWSQAIASLFHAHTREAIITKGYERVHLFSWDETAQLTAIAYRSATDKST